MAEFYTKKEMLDNIEKTRMHMLAVISALQGDPPSKMEGEMLRGYLIGLEMASACILRIEFKTDPSVH